MSRPPQSTVQHLKSRFPAITESAEETRALGGDFSTTLRAGTVLGLYGDLGSGKTQFVKGVAEGLGIPSASVRSPTFTILHTYEEGRHPLYHFDAYRVQTPDEFVELGFEDYVYGNGITCIEWADRVESLLPPHTIHLTFTHVAPGRRRITLRTEDGAS